MIAQSRETAAMKKLSPEERTFAGPIRILFNTPNPRLRGGPPTHLPMLEKALSDLVEVHAYDYGRKSDTETLVQKVFDRVGDLIRLWAICRNLRPNLIHHNTSFDHMAILRDTPLMFVARLQGVPIFLKIHGSWPEAFLPSFGFFGLARRFVLRCASSIGVLSAVEQREFEGAYPFVRGKVFVVKNIINSKFAEVERNECCVPTILYLSRLIRRKGPFDVLRAVPQVLSKEPAARFLFVGDGEDAEAFDREVAAMNLGDAVRRVTHVGIHECLSFYAKCWMLVFPTHYPEGMPMAVCEAMASGVPIVSTPTRFSRSYMTEGTHVVYNRAGDIDGIAENILRLCQNRELRVRMSMANRRLALECFTLDGVAQEYVDLYRKFLSGVKSRASKADY